jgi:hypothetical protein
MMAQLAFMPLVGTAHDRLYQSEAPCFAPLPTLQMHEEIS